MLFIDARLEPAISEMGCLASQMMSFATGARRPGDTRFGVGLERSPQEGFATARRVLAYLFGY